MCLVTITLRGGQNFGSNLFNNQQVKYSSSPEPAKWTYTNTKYWPTEGHIDFLAYAPFDNSKTLSGTKIDFTVSPTVKEQKDLLWANAANRTQKDNPVKFTFNHALSRLGYTVKLKEAYSNATITLNKITLAGSADGKTSAFYTSGTIDLSKTSSTDLWTTSSSDAKQNFNWFSGTQKLDGTYNTPETNYLFVIPQDFSKTEENADKLYVIVKYTISYTNGTTATMTSTVSSPIVKNFEQGKAYTINLTIGLTPIEFDATVEDWKDGAKIDDIIWE